MIRDQPVYRRQAFAQGLAACGYEVRFEHPTGQRPGDILCLWNRYSHWHETATRFEQNGGQVIISENGYIGTGGVSPHSQQNRDWYALAIGGHNGFHSIKALGDDRWQALGVRVEEWRATGGHVAVCPNRTFGRPGTIMPSDWAAKTAERLNKETGLPTRIRPHPGNEPSKTPLSDDFDGAAAIAIWSSSVGVHALVQGIPVICDGKYWICKKATGRTLDEARENGRKHRLEALQNLAYSQWHVDEIKSGNPFNFLLQQHKIGGLEQRGNAEPALTTP